MPTIRHTSIYPPYDRSEPTPSLKVDHLGRTSVDQYRANIDKKLPTTCRTAGSPASPAGQTGSSARCRTTTSVRLGINDRLLRLRNVDDDSELQDIRVTYST